MWLQMAGLCAAIIVAAAVLLRLVLPAAGHDDSGPIS